MMTKYLPNLLLIAILFLMSCNARKTKIVNNIYNLIPYPKSVVSKKGTSELNNSCYTKDTSLEVGCL